MLVYAGLRLSFITKFCIIRNAPKKGHRIRNVDYFISNFHSLKLVLKNSATANYDCLLRLTHYDFFLW